MIRFVPLMAFFRSAQALASAGFQFGATRHGQKLSGSDNSGARASARTGKIGRIFIYVPGGTPYAGLEFGFGAQDRDYTVIDASGTGTEMDYSLVYTDALVRARIPFISIGAGGYYGVTVTRIGERPQSLPRDKLKPSDAT